MERRLSQRNQRSILSMPRPKFQRRSRNSIAM